MCIEQMMVTTGDQDMCYYNFACAYPYHLLIDFSDFNHFFSNIGYVVLGTIFLLITKRRDYIDTMRQNATGAEVSHFPSFFLSLLRPKRMLLPLCRMINVVCFCVVPG